MSGAGDDPSAGDEAFKHDVRRFAERAANRAKAETGVGDQAHAPLPLVTFDEIDAVLDTQDFVQGVLIKGSSAVGYGDTNTGKTFFAVDLALHVAAGKEWNGRRVEQGPVVYCALEGGNGFRNRVVGWRAANGYEDACLPFVAIPSSLNLLDPEADTPRLIEAIRTTAARLGAPVQLVVIDTLARAMAGGNENAPDDMGALVRNMDAIRQATGACVLFIYHCGKDAAKGARGHSSLRAAIDTEIEVQANNDPGVRVATVVKQREMRKGDAFSFALETVVLGQNRHGEDVTTCVVRSSNEAPPKLRKPLTEEAESLRREIDNIFAAGCGRIARPELGMPEVPTISRAQLQEALVRSGWLRISAGESGASMEAGMPKPEHTRLWKRLNTLKLHGLISFNRYDVWLVGKADGADVAH